MRLIDAFKRWEQDELCNILVRTGGGRGRAIYRFVGFNQALELAVGNHGFSILAHGPDSEVWDLLLDIDVVPIDDEHGMRCRICRDEGEDELFSDTMSLYVDHILDPLLDWYHTKLSKATHLIFCRINGCTWVELAERPVIHASTKLVLVIRI